MPPTCFKCGIDASVGAVAIWDDDHFLWVWDSTSQWQDSTATWTKLPNAIWNRPDSVIEACNIYCICCWKNWAQFVKPGRKWALSRSCEEQAIRVGIQFEVDCRGHGHTGNPFYCPHCHLYLNHGAASLERHLSSFHRHTVAVKRKQRDEFEEPILFVSGCSHGDVASSLIKGKYIAKRWHHGKPVYEKEKADNPPVLIYFWKDPEPEMCGWWFSPREGASLVWAHHANCDPECLTVPKDGWKAPWDGEVDTALKITTEEIKETNQTNQSQTNQTQTNQTDQRRSELENSDFELRWEFLVANESHEEWQVMSKEMNDALEKRWAQGWDGDNGKLDGIVSNFYCFKMFQTFIVRGNFHVYE